ICKFRRENRPASQRAFVEVLRLARAMGVLKVGTVSVDGTHIRANASKDRNVRYDRARELQQQLTEEVDKLLEQAEQADQDDDPTAGGQRLEKIDRLQTLREKIRAARGRLEDEAKQQAQTQRPAYEAKVAA